MGNTASCCYAASCAACRCCCSTVETLGRIVFNETMDFGMSLNTLEQDNAMRQIVEEVDDDSVAQGFHLRNGDELLSLDYHVLLNLPQTDVQQQFSQLTTGNLVRMVYRRRAEDAPAYDYTIVEAMVTEPLYPDLAVMSSPALEVGSSTLEHADTEEAQPPATATRTTSASVQILSETVKRVTDSFQGHITLFVQRQTVRISSYEFDHQYIYRQSDSKLGVRDGLTDDDIFKFTMHTATWIKDVNAAEVYSVAVFAKPFNILSRSATSNILWETKSKSIKLKESEVDSDGDPVMSALTTGCLFILHSFSTSSELSDSALESFKYRDKFVKVGNGSLSLAKNNSSKVGDKFKVYISAAD